MDAVEKAWTITRGLLDMAKRNPSATDDQIIAEAIALGMKEPHKAIEVFRAMAA